MIWGLIGILLGILVGINTTFVIPIEYIKYTAVTIIGILDSLFGAIKAEVTKDEYNSLLFFTGLFFNVVLAVCITFLGEKLGLELYLATTVVFTFRIFSNLGIIRRALLHDFINKRANKEIEKNEEI